MGFVEGSNEGVALGLLNDAIACIDKDEGKVSGRGTGNHITGVLNVSWSICDDELALRGCEVAVGYIDGNTLLAFVLQTISEEAEVHVLEAFLF